MMAFPSLTFSNNLFCVTFFLAYLFRVDVGILRTSLITKRSNLGSDGPPIDIRTDAATDVGELLRRSAINREFTLSRAGPQEHNVIGSAERGVREVKEAIAVVRLELAKHQLDIVDSLVGWDGICRYVVAMHNLHGKKFGKTPRELLRDSPASKENPVSAMFCSQVLAETPESVKSIGRFVTAAYLWPVRNSFARGAVSNLRWHGNRVGMPRIDFLHDKPEGWKEMWNQRLAAWKARHPEAQKKEDKEKAKGEQPDESGDKKKKSEPERPGHRLEAQRKIPMAQDPWSRPTVFWNQSWDRICELSRKKEGEGFVFFCGSQGCRKTFKNEFAYLQHLWSKCDTPGHPSREIAKRWSTDKPFVAVSGDPDHPDPQWVEKQQKELKEKMRKEIQDYEDEKSKKLRRAQGKEEESSSTGSGSTDSEDDDEVSKTAKKVGISVESLGPVGPEDSDIPEIPDGESLVAFLEDKKAEKAAKKEKVLVEESAASKRKSGVTEAGKRMLDQTLDEIVADIQEEVPPSTDLTSRCTSGGVRRCGVSADFPSAGIPISAVTEHDVPKDHDSKLETCKACAGSGRADPDMNEAIQVLLDAQKASMASVSQEVKKEDSPKGKDADSQDKDDRLGAFTFCEGVATDFCIVELCCNRFSELSRAAKVLGCSYLGVHDQLEVPSTCQQVLKTLRLAIAEGKKVEGKKVGRIYCHCSLPFSGGSPLLNFSDTSIRERHQAKFLELLSCLTEYWEGIRRIDPQSLFSFELPHQNRYWKLADMRNFRTQWGLDFYGIVSGCRTGLMTDRGVPIGKRYRIITNHQEIAQRIHARFSQCV